MKRWFAGITLAGAVFFAATNALAGAVEETKFALHVKATSKKTTTSCNTWSPVPPESTWTTSPPLPCDNFVTAADVTTNYYLYLVIAETHDLGIAGISCGVGYGTGLNIGWKRCSDLEFSSGNWPSNGGGNRITWANQTNCQDSMVPPNGVMSVAGYFTAYAYGPDRFSITTNNNVPTPELAVVSCQTAETQIDPSQTGFVDFSAGATEPGCNPCTALYPPNGSGCSTPTRPATWGRIKNMYGTGGE